MDRAPASQPMGEGARMTQHDRELAVKLVRAQVDGIWEQVYSDCRDPNQGITLSAIGNAISEDSLSWWCKEKRKRILDHIERIHDLLDELEGE